MAADQCGQQTESSQSTEKSEFPETTLDRAQTCASPAEAPLPIPVSPNASDVDLAGPISEPRASMTVITATNPKIVTKSFALLNNPWPSPTQFTKSTNADVYEGTVEVKAIASLAEFVELLMSLRTDQCLTYGVPPRSGLKLVTAKRWTELGQPDDHVARTKAAFSWSSGAGVMMLDYDAPKDGSSPLTQDELVAAVRDACPGLAGVAMVWWPSTSSCIVNASTGEEYSGVKGQRLYLIVHQACDIERAGKALLTYLAAKGHVRFEVSKSGALLERGMFDASVWQSNRIDFAAGANCTPPLEQRRGAPMIVAGEIECADTRTLIPEPSAAVRALADGNRKAARATVAPEAAAVQAEWIEVRAAELLARAPGATIETARDAARRVIECRVLPGDWELTLEGGERVNVLAVLDEPARYHGKLTLDPVEPEYDGKRAVGKLYLFNARPCLYSFAHGGASYKLERQPARIERVRGREYDAAEALLDRMRQSPEVYDYGPELVTVERGRAHRLDEHTLRHWIGGAVQFFFIKQKRDELIEVLDDPPYTICRTVLSLGATRGLRPLVAIQSAPTLRQDGTVLATPGYDAATGFLLVEDGDDVFVEPPERPTHEEARAALARLWKPFEKFPFVGPLDRAAHLAALLTAVARPSLPTCPAFAYDAPAQGSGKTLLAQCVSIIATGEQPDAWAFTSRTDDDELRKRITAALLDGRRAVLLDNLVGTFDSASLAAALTSANWSDRILQKSKTATLPNKAMFLLSGNNLTLTHDMPRRTLTCRIDPRVPAPYAREFDLDPKRYCMANRQTMVAAALTLVRFYLASGAARPGGGRMASFEQWDDWIRQTIIYIDREIAPGQFGDVIELVAVSQSNDPEQEVHGQLLVALYDIFGDRKFDAGEVAAAVDRGEQPLSIVEPSERALAEVMREFRRDRQVLTSRSIAKVLGNRKDRIVRGLRLIGVHDAYANMMRWCVEKLGSGNGQRPPWTASGPRPLHAVA